MDSELMSKYNNFMSDILLKGEAQLCDSSEAGMFYIMALQI